MESIVILIFFFAIFIGIFSLVKLIVNFCDKHWLSKANQDSYNYYTEFLNEQHVTGSDEGFKEKLLKIEHAIKDGVYDIRKIAELSGCTYEECVLKIKYLESKQYLNNIHIDHNAKKVIKCTPKELALLKKYLPFLRTHHFTLDEITKKKRVGYNQDFEKLRDQIYNDLKYLVDNNLISWIKLNEVDKEIIYFTDDKKHLLTTIHCPNCGAGNEVVKGHKVRCKYCKMILEEKNKTND